MGRGTKTKKMDAIPEWTPGPGQYQAKTDFEKRTQMVDIYPDIEGQEISQEEVMRWD